MERFLYRLSRSPYADKFVLKGALLFTVWRASVSRSTMDIDLLGRTENSVENIASIIRDICNLEVEADGLIFDAGSISAERIIEHAFYRGIRGRFEGNLGNARIPIQLDIGFGDVVVLSAKLKEYPTILDFPVPRLQSYSMESSIAEKFETMVRLGKINSRIKDFFDIWTLSRQFDFEGGVLATAIKQTFSCRGTAIPDQLSVITDDLAEDSSKEAQWRGFLRRNRLENIPDFKTIVVSIAEFLGPPASALSVDQSFSKTWVAPGSWSG